MKTSIRALRSWASRHGLRPGHDASKKEIAKAIQEIGEHPEPQIEVPDWTFHEPGPNGTSVTVTDPSGWWSGSVGLDGQFRLVHHGSPNLIERQPGQLVSTDEILEGPNLDEFIERLQALRDGADPILEKIHEHIMEVKEQSLMQIEENSAVAEELQDTPTQEMNEDELIMKAAKERGLKDNVNVNGAVKYLCEYFEMPLGYEEVEEGTDKTRQKKYKAEELRAQVLEKLEAK